MRLIGGTISDTPVKEIGDGSAFSVGGASGANLGTDPNYDDVVLLVQPHAGDTGVEGLHDRGPAGRTATIASGSVTIVDQSTQGGLSPIYGAYADPSSAKITFSDDNGLKFGTGDFCLEFIGTRLSTTVFSEHAMYTAGNTGTRHMQAHIYAAANYWYSPSPSLAIREYVGSGSHFNNTAHCRTVGKTAENVTFDRRSGTIRCFINGHMVGQTASHTADYDTNWVAFTLLSDTSSTFSGNLIAFRFTHASRYDAIHSPPLTGFPES